MTDQPTLIVDGRTVPICGERNLLELVRGAGIDIPTFCYHSNLSVYGACRLCIVDVEGQGIQASCSIKPQPGMGGGPPPPHVRAISHKSPQQQQWHQKK